MNLTQTNIPGGFYPLSSAQNRVWFMENLNEDTRAYNDPYDFRIIGKTDPAIVEKSLQILIGRHEAFRTVFKTVNGVPHQVVLPHISFHLDVKDIRNRTPEEIPELVKGYSIENSEFKFHLETGPLLNLSLILTGENESVLLLNFHHIISDAVSIKIFIDELFGVYNQLAKGKTADLPQIPFTYRDYAVWENEWLRSPECDAQVEFWKEELKGIPEMLQLPLDFTRPKAQRFTGAEFHFSMNAEMRNSLSALSKKHGTSMMIPMLSAFAILLSKYSSQEDLVIGVPVANRAHEELQNIIGVLINSLPLRFRVNKQLTVSEIIKETKDNFLRAYENKGVPFERLVEGLKIRRSLDSSPVFQVLFNFLTAFRSETNYDDLSLLQLPGERKAALVDLTLTILDQKSGINCVIQYDTDLFKRETIERMAGHYLTILQAIVKNDSLKTGKVPLLTSAEKEQILGKWNNYAHDFPEEKSIHKLFEEQVKLIPDAIAVEDDHNKLTFSELNTMANRLASWLKKKGAREGTSVALFTERSVDMITSVLAIVKSGAALLPLDPVYPSHRINLIMKNAKPLLVITQESLKDLLPETDAGLIFLDNSSEWQSEDQSDLPAVDSENIAYIIYTSGSTGQPKGVRIQHRSLVNLINYYKRILNVSEKDALLTVTTIAFDIAELDVYLALCSGAKLIIGSKEAALDTSLLISRIRESGATIFQATPVTYRMLMMNNWEGNKNLRIISGGEAMSKELGQKLISICGEVWNSYGPTETTVYSTALKVSYEDTVGEGFVSIGHPIDNTRVYILNEDHEPVPVNISGELFIGGDGISPGYVDLPEITSQRFIPDPFSGIPGSKIYASGDIVKYLPDGKIIFLNRGDSQVKIRGFRIELGEIESVISQYGDIKENVVDVRMDDTGEKMLVAYLIPKEGTNPDISGIKQFLRERLPDYMLPSSFVMMEEFPLTANKKIDRKLLPEPDQALKTGSAPYVQPQTPTEKKLSVIWESLLKIDKISAEEDFFEAGGHSMIAVGLIIQIEKEFGVKIPLAMLFENSTLRGMAMFIDQGVSKLNEKFRSLVPIRPDGVKKPLFLIHGLNLNASLYNSLLKWLDPEQPVYGLQAKGLNGKETPLESVEDIAGWYISEIMTVEKDGPYIIAGFSFGGRIAFEMARQLIGKGKEIAFLGLFDIVPDAHDENKSLVTGISNVINHFSLNIKSLFKNGHDRGADAKGAEDELAGHLKEIYNANLKASKKYQIKPLEVTVHLFKTKQTDSGKESLSNHWDKYALGGVITHDLPGDRSSIFAPPNDKYFAEILQRHNSGVHNNLVEAL